MTIDSMFVGITDALSTTSTQVTAVFLTLDSIIFKKEDCMCLNVQLTCVCVCVCSRVSPVSVEFLVSQDQEEDLDPRAHKAPQEPEDWE